eukprot:scaffold284054_cov36-Tisochrysis_lutea.AAC.2
MGCARMLSCEQVQPIVRLVVSTAHQIVNPITCLGCTTWRPSSLIVIKQVSLPTKLIISSEAAASIAQVPNGERLER